MSLRFELKKVFIFLLLFFIIGINMVMAQDCPPQSVTITSEELDDQANAFSGDSSKACGEYGAYNCPTSRCELVLDNYQYPVGCQDKSYGDSDYPGQKCFGAGGGCKESCLISYEFHYSAVDDCADGKKCCKTISEDAKLDCKEECLFDGETEINCDKKCCVESCETDNCKDSCRTQYSQATWKDAEEMASIIPSEVSDRDYDSKDQCKSWCRLYVTSSMTCDNYCSEKMDGSDSSDDSSYKSCGEMNESECNSSSACDWRMNANGAWSCENHSDDCTAQCNIAGKEDWGAYTDCIATCQGAQNGSSDGCPGGTTYKSSWCTNEGQCGASPRQGKESWHESSRCSVAGDGICAGCFPPNTGGGGNTSKGKPYCTIPSNLNVVALEPGQEINFDITFIHPGRSISDGFFGYINYGMPSSKEQGACGAFPRYACFDTRTRINGIQTDCGVFKPTEDVEGVGYLKYCDDSTCKIPFTFIPYDNPECEIKIGIRNSSGSGDCKMTFQINSTVSPESDCNCSKLEGESDIITRALDSQKIDKDRILSFSCHGSGTSIDYAEFRIIDQMNGNVINSSNKKDFAENMAYWNYKLEEGMNPGKYSVQCRVCANDDNCSDWGQAGY